MLFAVVRGILKGDAVHLKRTTLLAKSSELCLLLRMAFKVAVPVWATMLKMTGKRGENFE